jgi:hypothetical protein
MPSSLQGWLIFVVAVVAVMYLVNRVPQVKAIVS